VEFESTIVFQGARSWFLRVSGGDPIFGRRQSIDKMGATPDGGAARFSRCCVHSDVLRKAVMQTILCAVDESTGAAEAVAVAAGLSKGLGLRLVLAHVTAGYRRTSGIDTGAVQERDSGRRLLDQVAREHSLESAADCRAEAGDRVSELSRIAGEEAAVLIVVGSRGRSRRGRGRLSRLSTDLRSTAPCPVLIVPPRPRR
jgi:nucleotide-binding universal stress UspA family protein